MGQPLIDLHCLFIFSIGFWQFWAEGRSCKNLEKTKTNKQTNKQAPKKTSPWGSMSDWDIGLAFLLLFLVAVFFVCVQHRLRFQKLIHVCFVIKFV